MPIWKILLPVFLFITNFIAAQTRPNIIYIMADDLGYGHKSCYGRNYYEHLILIRWHRSVSNS